MDEATLTAIATARAFQRASDAQRVVVILDRPDPVMIEVDELQQAEVTVGEHATPAPPDETPPQPLPHIHAIPHTAINIDLVTGELSAPIGAVDHLKDAVLGLAAAFGGLTVASAEFATDDPDTPITLAARVGDNVVLAAGDVQFEL